MEQRALSMSVMELRMRLLVHTTVSVEMEVAIHVHCDMIKDIEHHMSQEHGFKIDPFRTVFYGTCQECIDTKKDK